MMSHSFVTQLTRDLETCRGRMVDVCRGEVPKDTHHFESRAVFLQSTQQLVSHILIIQAAAGIMRQLRVVYHKTLLDVLT